ncbi:MAG: DUF5103 domain-containing protein [Paludibacter sp.]|nr:DUF5103 domain-containing protein [Bacteroidales bacterium]MCM1068935.1 DUF5103 domain-containing protein [Prevotella sp.]MCM1353196.1 DUF5103 domain-containing protein [Bacteroides sp.]MCM1442518.1 DUF5103 domain-containing protein [Muribaculum sp.]MCM1481361.1 DUF5103 domain-containing protein [Paludibacter sp.]
MKRLLLILILCYSVCIRSIYSEQTFRNGKQVYYSCVHQKNIKSLRIRYADTQSIDRPILQLNSEDVLEISFDELSHITHYYTYTLLHLNADWTRSDLLSNEYVAGFTTQDITDYDYSLNTQQLYTHYRFEFPNEDMRPKVSGNYALLIYEDGDPDKVVAYACFSVLEPLTAITATLRSQTDIELSGRYQQLDIDVNTAGLNLRNQEEITLVVRQNNRTDNQAYNPRPTYVESNRLRYINQRALIFEGGNEYRHFDIASVYFMGTGVDYIDFDHTYYQAYLYPSVNQAQTSYLTEYDSNGQYIINAERTNDDDWQADYMWVHFLLPEDTPWFDGSVFIGGDLFYNQMRPQNQMQYDNTHKTYYLSAYLKQGGYDFQYWFRPKNSTQATTQRTEGSHWQTQNEYSIYVYYRPFGGRYDQLICFERLQ